MAVISIFRNLARLREALELIRVLLFKRTILVFQMGKVGSLSVLYAIHRSLEEQEGIKDVLKYVYYGHRFSFIPFGASKPLRHFYRYVTVWRAKLGLPLSVICPIREPIARDVSAFFYLYYRYMAERNSGYLKVPINDLTNLFLMDSRQEAVGDLFQDIRKKRPIVSNSYTAEQQFALNWLDEHLKPQTHIDVYRQPFPIDRKWQIYKRGFTRVLLYRTDLKRSEQTKLISRFLGIKLDEIGPENTAKGKNYAKLYSQFRESAKLPEQYIRRMHDSRFAQHFWSPEELKAAADKWRAV